MDMDKGEPRLLGEMGCDEEECENIQTGRSACRFSPSIPPDYTPAGHVQG